MRSILIHSRMSNIVLGRKNHNDEWQKETKTVV